MTNSAVPTISRSVSLCAHRQRDQRFIEIRGLSRVKFGDVLLGCNVVVAPHRMVSHPLAKLSLRNKVLRFGERDRIHDAFKPGREANTEFYRLSPHAGALSAAKTVAICSGVRIDASTALSRPAA